MSAVLYEASDAVAWITLNRPDALNAISTEVRELLPRFVRQAEADASVRVTVVQGAGERAFCAGADIKEFAAVTSPANDRQARAQNSWIRAFDEARKPIIASIQGFCLGGGLEIALACDLRIAAANALFGFPEMGLGIITGVGGSQRIGRIVGLGRALDLILTGERIDAARAYEIGLVSRLARSSLLEETRVLAGTIAAKPSLATIFAKEAVKNGLEMDLPAALRMESDLLVLLLTAEDRLEATGAFKEKRKPVFHGR